MVFKFQPGMKMYEVVWERDGEKRHVALLQAADETGAISRAEETFAEYPEIDFDPNGATVHARLYNLPPSAEGDDWRERASPGDVRRRRRPRLLASHESRAG